MRRWAALCFPLLREPFGLPAILVALALMPGCVTRGTHREVVRERDQYREESARRATRIEQLEASNAALSEERVALIDEIEDLRQLREELEGKVEVLEQVRGELETNLRESESELVRHTEEVEQLRQTYGGLVADLESEVAAGRIEIDRLREGLRLNLSQEILFGSGSAQLSEAGQGGDRQGGGAPRDGLPADRGPGAYRRRRHPGVPRRALPIELGAGRRPSCQCRAPARRARSPAGSDECGVLW